MLVRSSIMHGSHLLILLFVLSVYFLAYSAFLVLTIDVYVWCFGVINK